jgi:hypothetical protein
MAYVDFVGALHKSTPRDYVQRVWTHRVNHDLGGQAGVFWDFRRFRLSLRR